ncbi:hypothetical protein H8959_013026, partial [Pygathrix nigripes]
MRSPLPEQYFCYYIASSFLTLPTQSIPTQKSQANEHRTNMPGSKTRLLKHELSGFLQVFYTIASDKTLDRKQEAEAKMRHHQIDPVQSRLKTSTERVPAKVAGK